jgi:hypothetical protein
VFKAVLKRLEKVSETLYFSVRNLCIDVQFNETVNYLFKF